MASVVISREEYDGLIVALERSRAVIGARREAEAVLRGRLVQTWTLLLIALREYGELSGKKDLDAFSRRWLREHRKIDTGGVPFS